MWTSERISITLMIDNNDLSNVLCNHLKYDKDFTRKKKAFVEFEDFERQLCHDTKIMYPNKCQRQKMVTHILAQLFHSWKIKCRSYYKPKKTDIIPSVEESSSTIHSVFPWIEYLSFKTFRTTEIKSSTISSPTLSGFSFLLYSKSKYKWQGNPWKGMQKHWEQM